MYFLQGATKSGNLEDDSAGYFNKHLKKDKVLNITNINIKKYSLYVLKKTYNIKKNLKTISVPNFAHTLGPETVFRFFFAFFLFF